MSSKRKWLPAENGGKWAYMGNKITSRPHSVGLLSFTPPPALKVHCSCFFLNHPQYIFSSHLMLLMLHLVTCVFLFRQIRLQIKQDKKSTKSQPIAQVLRQMGYVFITPCAHCALCKQTKEVQVMGVVHTREKESSLLYHLDKMALPVCWSTSFCLFFFLLSRSI